MKYISIKKFKNLDKTKPTAAITISTNPVYDHIYRWGFKIIDYIQDRYNLIVISTDYSTIEHPKLKNIHALIKVTYDKAEYLKRNSEDSDFAINNFNLIKEKTRKLIEDNDIKVDYMFNILDILYIGTCNNMSAYFPEKYKSYIKETKMHWHDYVGTDEELLRCIKEAQEYYFNNFHKFSSVYAFSISKTSAIYFILDALNSYHKIKHSYNFIIDPSFNSYIFKHFNIPYTDFHFVDDNRGTRNYKKFPIDILQHVISEGEYLVKDPNKTNDFILAARILARKEQDRISIYKRFINELSGDSELYSPIEKTRGYWKTKQAETEIEAIKRKEEGADALNLALHPSYCGSLSPHDYRTVLKNYKYSLVLKCTSYWDSFNFRPVHYLANGVLPLFDTEYDPEYKHIPKHLQDILVCKDANDINDKISYFNEHEDERIDLINQMSELLIHSVDTNLENYFTHEKHTNFQRILGTSAVSH